MKLSNQDKEMIKTIILNATESLKNKKINYQNKIHIDKELLDSLIFHKTEIKEKDEPKITLKYPIWTGQFLRYIDLSELSFEDVIWEKDAYLFLARDIKFLKKYSDIQDITIDFSYTNAPISFKDKSKTTLISSCNFEGLDLSNVTLYPMNFDLENEGLIIKGNNNFKNTGIRLIDDNEQINYHFKQQTNQETLETSITTMNQMIKEGIFDGCYLNNQKIENGQITQVEAPSRKTTKKQEYNQYLDKIVDNILDQFNELNEDNNKQPRSNK